MKRKQQIRAIGLVLALTAVLQMSVSLVAAQETPEIPEGMDEDLYNRLTGNARTNNAFSSEIQGFTIDDPSFDFSGEFPLADRGIYTVDSTTLSTATAKNPVYSADIGESYPGPPINAMLTDLAVVEISEPYMQTTDIQEIVDSTDLPDGTTSVEKEVKYKYKIIQQFETTTFLTVYTDITNWRSCGYPIFATDTPEAGVEKTKQLELLNYVQVKEAIDIFPRTMGSNGAFPKIPLIETDYGIELIDKDALDEPAVANYPGPEGTVMDDWVYYDFYIIDSCDQSGLEDTDQIHWVTNEIIQKYKYLTSTTGGSGEATDWDEIVPVDVYEGYSEDFKNRITLKTLRDFIVTGEGETTDAGSVFSPAAANPSIRYIPIEKNIEDIWVPHQYTFYIQNTFNPQWSFEGITKALDDGSNSWDVDPQEAWFGFTEATISSNDDIEDWYDDGGDNIKAAIDEFNFEDYHSYGKIESRETNVYYQETSASAVVDYSFNNPEEVSFPKTGEKVVEPDDTSVDSETVEWKLSSPNVMDENEQIGAYSAGLASGNTVLDRFTFPTDEDFAKAKKIEGSDYVVDEQTWNNVLVPVTVDLAPQFSGRKVEYTVKGGTMIYKDASSKGLETGETDDIITSDFTSDVTLGVDEDGGTTEWYDSLEFTNVYARVPLTLTFEVRMDWDIARKYNYVDPDGNILGPGDDNDDNSPGDINYTRLIDDLVRTLWDTSVQGTMTAYEDPTFWDKFNDFFGGIFSGLADWWNDLLSSEWGWLIIVALVGLAILLLVAFVPQIGVLFGIGGGKTKVEFEDYPQQGVPAQWGQPKIVQSAPRGAIPLEEFQRTVGGGRVVGKLVQDDRGDYYIVR